MELIAVSVPDVLLVIGLGAAGFLVVTLVCAAVLAMLHLVLPAADSGAARIDEAAASTAGADEIGTPAAASADLDSEPNA